ncbi:30S ribosomal protein S16 [Flavobacterium sp.]|jgi:small subunit ribosomal protein S16|uniref:30S ribosomal protein S16 n=1 Tax=Flavobacterium sp. TaxID=239 RepID=UPI0037BFE468
MPVRIRLQRHGKKGKPFFWIVAADARSKRDGKFLEKIGTYNPNTNPATIDLNVDSAVQWLHNGAQPTDTAKAILSYKGALLKHHLDGGVRKGALTQEQADAKLATWLDAKAGKVDAKKDGLSKAQADAKAKAFKAEQAANEKRIAAIADAAKAEEVVEAAAEVTEEVAEEVVEAAAEVTEEVAEEVVEAAAEVTEEVAVEEVVEAVAEETTEAPAAEENNEEKEA